jgi:SSS family solute:Na+ symporter
MLFTVINGIVVTVYLVGVCYLVHKGRGTTRLVPDHMIAGQEQPAGVLDIAHAATLVGTTAIGFGGTAAMFGFSLVWVGFFSILVGVFIAFVFCGKRTRLMGRALNAYTFPEVLGERYQSPFIQGFAGIVVFAFIPIYTAAILIAMARLIQTSLHIPYLLAVLAFSLFLVLYVILGGFKGVKHIDAFYGLFMSFMMAIFCYLTYKLLGGVIPAHQALTAIAPLVPDRLVDGGLEGWTTGLRIGSPFWWIACSSIIGGVGIGSLVQPQLVVSFMKAESERELNWGVPAAGLFMLAMMGVPLIVGPLTNAIFVDRAGAISIAMGGGNVDKVIPIYINTIMPWWFGPLFLVGMMAASTAALSSQFRVGGTCLGRDFYAKGMRFRRQGEVFTTKLGIALTIIATILWGLVLPRSSIVVATAFFFGLCAATFLPAYLLGIYWKGVTKAGAIASMVGGFCTSFIWLIFFHYLGLAAFFGPVNLVVNTDPESWPWLLQYVDPIVIALPVSFVLCIWVSRKTKRMSREHINRCFKYITNRTVFR